MTLTRTTASVVANVSQKTVDRAVVDGELPVASYVANRPRFEESEIYAWIERRKESKARNPFRPVLRLTERMVALEMSE